MAKKKAGGKVRQKGNRRGKSLGLKISGGEKKLRRFGGDSGARHAL